MSVYSSLRKATTDTLSVVSTTSGVINDSVSGIGSLAQGAAEHAHAWRNTTIRELAEQETTRTTRRRMDRSIADAQFYADIDAQLKANPSLEAYFKEAMAQYEKSDDAVTVRLAAKAA